MKQFITAHTIANHVRMGHKHSGKIYGIVEGQTDVAFYRYFFDTTACQLVLADGKPNAVGALSLLNTFQPVFCILDADFWPITGNKPFFTNLFLTDTHDTEALVIRSDAFAKTLNNYSDLAKLDAFLARLQKQDIREVLLISGRHLGYLRLANDANSHNLNFKALDFADFISPTDLGIDVQKLVAALLLASPRTTVSAQRLLQEMQSFAAQNHDDWLLVCGHDLVRLLVIGLKKIFGHLLSYDPAEIEAGLRQAFEKAHFSQTNLYQSIKQWSQNTLKRTVLSC